MSESNKKRYEEIIDRMYEIGKMDASESSYEDMRNVIFQLSRMVDDFLEGDKDELN